MKQEKVVYTLSPEMKKEMDHMQEVLHIDKLELLQFLLWYWKKNRSWNDLKEFFMQHTGEPLFMFARDCLTFEKGEIVSRQNLYFIYQWWCDRESMNAKPKFLFIRDINQQFPQMTLYRPVVDGKQVRCVRGVQVKQGIRDEVGVERIGKGD